MLHVFRRRQSFTHRPGRSSGWAAAPRPVQSNSGLSSLYSLRDAESSRISVHVCPKRMSPLPTLIKLRFSPPPTFPSSESRTLSLPKASQPRTAPSSAVSRVFIISYLSSLRKQKLLITEQRPNPDSCLFVRTLISAPFSLSSNICVRAAKPRGKKKDYSNIRLSCLTLSPRPPSSLPGPILGHL